MNWPPKYRIRISARAKRPFVQLAPNRGLELVIPKRKLKKNKNPFQLNLWGGDQNLRTELDSSMIDALLQENKTWIQKHLSRWDLEHSQKHTEPMLPDKLNFLGLDKEILIEYQDNPLSNQYRIFELENKVIIRGPLQSGEEKIILILRRYLHKQAKHYLLPWLARLSLATGLRYTEAFIRHQSSLWGSCTAKHKISLNSKLLFLPKQLIEYVILHELCHTVHLNHSKRFWNLLKKYDPHCLQHRKALRASSNYLPRFCERSRPSLAENILV